MFKTPVLLLVFNRPEETKQVFEAIRERAPAFLYIAADGPRPASPGEKELCDEVRKIVLAIDWPCEVKQLFRTENAGCKKAVSEAITWFFSNVEQGIILEDDCVPDQTFFKYCEALLEKYRDDENIISISGTNLGYTFSGDQSYGFSRFMNMWGWATWRRSARLIDYDMKGWRSKWSKNWFLYRSLQTALLPIDYNWIKYWKNYFNLTASGRIDTWDYQWIFTQLQYRKLSVFPSKNLVKNIGFSKTATHTFHPDYQLSLIGLYSLPFPLKDPARANIEIAYENFFIKRIWFPYRRDTLFQIIRSSILNAPLIFRMVSFFKKTIHKVGI